MLKHGMFGTKIYSSWSAMVYRCRNPKAKAYPKYGGRGIKVCDRWLDFTNFYADMSEGHWDGAEIDRKDNDGNYEPGNCVWETSKTNLQNKRNTWFVEYRGAQRKLLELCEEFSIPRRNVEARLNVGWGLEDALRTPVRHRGVVTYRVGSEMLSIKQMSEVSGESITAIRSRMYRGATPDQAVHGSTGIGE
jgi:hypothetical protein